MKNILYTVTSLRKYENGEIYYGLDSIFETENEALQYINADMNEELQNHDPDDCFVDRKNFSIEDGSHFFSWKLQKMACPFLME